MMKLVCNTLGVLLCILSVVGFVNHDAMGMNLNAFHDVLLLIAGAAALYYGIAGTEFQARYCCRALGVIFGLLGVIGIVSGGGMVTISELIGKHETHLIRLIPQHLELGTADSMANILFGVIGLIAGFLPRQTEIEVDMAGQKAKQKVTSGR